MKDMLYFYCGCYEEMFGKEGLIFLYLMFSSIVVSWEFADILFLYDRIVIFFL